jgi:ABC-2 type transport system ATP-binding protein
LCNRVAIIKEGKIIQLEKISALQENNYKKIKVQTTANIDQNYFNIGGVSNLDVKQNIISFLFRGNLNLIMKKISEIEIANVWIEEPDLEEIFLHYYEKGA